MIQRSRHAAGDAANATREIPFMRKTFISLAAAAAALGAGTSHAQFAKPEDAIKYRQGAFTVMAAHFGRIGAVAKGAVPFDPAAVQSNAAIVEQMARLPWAGFGPGTDQGRENRAKAEIWTNNAKFNEQAKRLEAETQKLSVAAKSGDLGQVKTAFGAVAQACKACHDDFRRD
jgi:cytochrome c556